MNELRIVTEQQLQSGFTIRWPNGSERRVDYVVVRELGNGRFEVKEPQRIGDHFIFGAISMSAV